MQQGPIHNQMLTERKALFLPKWVSSNVYLIYAIALITTIALMPGMALNWYWILFGITEIGLFFYAGNIISKKWAIIPSRKRFAKKLFWTGWGIRFAVMLFLYWFFQEMTGQPFMFHAADAVGYSGEAEWMVDCIQRGTFMTEYWDYKFGAGGGVSDFGYPMWLAILYLISGKSIIFARFIKTIISAYTCVLLYKLAARNFGEQVGRLAGIFCMLMPEFIIYSGMHLKETEMIFLIVAYLNEADKLLRLKRFNWRSLALVMLLAGLLFCFRTVVGLAAIMSTILTFVMTSERVASWGRRWSVIIVMLIAIGYFAGGRIASEVQTVWEQRDSNQSSRLSVQVKTNSFAKYAGATVFAPLMFTIPFPTMVETEGQENSRMLHGGLVVKNIMSGFCILGIIMLLITGEWRNHILLGAMLISYLVVIIFSAFGAAQRFHMPAEPLELTFAAYGLSLCKKREKRWYTFWCIGIGTAIILWQLIKLRGRGM